MWSLRSENGSKYPKSGNPPSKIHLGDGKGIPEVRKKGPVNAQKGMVRTNRSERYGDVNHPVSLKKVS